MDIKNFENNFLSSLKYNKEECINIIENNETIIKEKYDKACSNENISKFVECINKIILENEIDFNLFQKVLNHPLFSNIYSKFKSSDILIEACKEEKINTIYWLVSINVDVNLTDKNEKTAIMYLVDQGNSKELEFLLSKGANVNFINKSFESALSILLNNLKIKKCDEVIFNKILDLLNKSHCDFNIPIDQYQNTAFMELLMFDNPIHIINIAKKKLSIDFSIKNKYGENVSSLLVKLNNNILISNLMNNPSFDFGYRDQLSGNSLLMLSAISQPMLLEKLIKMNSFNINELNNKNENALILATKAGCISNVKMLLKKNINCNHQDDLGNTALHYAVQLDDPYLVSILKKRIDCKILNKKGLSPKSEEALRNSNEIVKKIMLKGYTIDIEKNNFELPKIAYKLFKETFEYLSPRVSEDYITYPIEEILKNASVPYYPVFQDKKKLLADLFLGFFVPI